MSSPNVLGKMMDRLRKARLHTKTLAIDELWERNGLGTGQAREGYKLAETQRVDRNGSEITEYRLYKLIDRSVVTISADINTEVATGLDGKGK